MWDNQHSPPLLVDMYTNKYSLENNGTLWKSSWYYPVKVNRLRHNNITPGYKSDRNFHIFGPGDIKIFIVKLPLRELMVGAQMSSNNKMDNG